MAKKDSLKRFCLILVLMLVVKIASATNVIFASTNRNDINQNVITSSEMIQNALATMRFPDDVYISFEPVGINTKTDEKTVIIEFAGMSAFLSFDKSVKTENVVYESSDSNIVFPNDGRLLALSSGEAVINVTYEGVSKTITVIVEKQFDRTALRNYLSERETANLRAPVLASNYDERIAIINKAMAMVNQVWVPTKDLVKWGPLNGTWKFFPKNEIQWGIPYTQAVQVDEITFLNKMSASNFYTPNETISTGTGAKVCPQYGNDCSAFVSFCWSIPRINTTEFYKRINNGTYKKLSSYSQLNAGDAVVVPGSHMFLIGLNYEVPPSGSSFTESYVCCYEQTPPYAQDTFRTYAELEKNGYVPFSKFK